MHHINSPVGKQAEQIVTVCQRTTDALTNFFAIFFSFISPIESLTIDAVQIGN